MTMASSLSDKSIDRLVSIMLVVILVDKKPFLSFFIQRSISVSVFHQDFRRYDILSREFHEIYPLNSM